MLSIIRATVLIAATGMLFACKPAPEPEQIVEEDPVEETDSTGSANLIEACTIKMAAPEANEWTTYWDASAVPMNGEGPSSARSSYWATEEERKRFVGSATIVPLSIRCTSDGPPSVSVSISAAGSARRDIPMASAEYSVIGKGDGPVPPGQFAAAKVTLDQRQFTVTRGTLDIDNFDASGVRGRFRLDGQEDGEGGEEFELEGTFDLPCRGGPNEGACEANRTVAE